MPTSLTDVDAFTAPIQGPADGDVQGAAAYNLGFQGLANRTRNLKNRIDGGDAITKRLLASDFAYDPTEWEIDGATAGALVSSGLSTTGASFNLGKIVPVGAVVTAIRFLVNPNAAAITCEIYDLEWDFTTPLAPSHTLIDDTDSSGTALQVVTMSGLPTTMTVDRTIQLRVMAQAGTDVFQAVEVVFTSPAVENR
jgi:hypothetical protein